MDIKKTVLYIGLNDQYTRIQEVETEKAKNIVTECLFNVCDGMTVYDSVGVYKHDDGTKIIEKSLRVEIFGTLYKGFLRAVENIKNVLNQESIIVEYANTNTELIG